MIRINYVYIYFNICFLRRWTQKEKAQREADEKAKQSPASSRAGTPGKDDKDKDDGNAATPPPKRSVIPTLTTSVTRLRGHPRKEPQLMKNPKMLQRKICSGGGRGTTQQNGGMKN